MSGYVRIHRALIGHPAFRTDAEAMAFAWMILRAAWKPVRIRYKGRSITLQRGQLVASVRDMAEALDRSKGWVERLLERLKSEDMAGTVSGTGVNVITICNYDEYQSSQDDAGTVRGTAAGHGHDMSRDSSGTVRGTAVNAASCCNEMEKHQPENDAGTVQKREPGQRRDTGRDTKERSKEDKEGKNPSEGKPSSGYARADETAQRKPDPFPRPAYCDPQVWKDFLTNRRRKRMPNTPSAHKLLMSSLEREADDEWPPSRLLEHAAAKGWGSIHNPCKDQQQDNRYGSSQPPHGIGRTEAAAAAAVNRIAQAEGRSVAPQSRTGIGRGDGDRTRPLPDPVRALGYEPGRPDGMDCDGDPRDARYAR